MIRTIPLGKLVPSERNVRRRGDEQADAELRADIAARGLLQNLVVSPLKKPRGCFAVEAGERRRRALVSLAADGALPADHEVSCLVVDVSGAREASLAENFQRLAMNPADECLAFSSLVEQGASAEDVARRFGLTVRFVEGRLRLADLAPVVFEALGAGEITLDMAKAYAATSDRERQAWVFEQLSGYGPQYPDSVRRMMTQATVAASDRRAVLVGDDAYLAAGGRIERDLFDEEGTARWLDVALLERLAAEKMEALAEQAKVETGLAFVRPTLETWVGYGRLEGLRRVVLDAPELTDEEKETIDRLQAEIDGLAEVIDDEEAEDDAREAAELQVAGLGERIEAIADKRPVLDDELKGQLGTFLLLGDDGVPQLDRCYYAEIEAARTEAPDSEATDAGAPGTVAAGGRVGGDTGSPRERKNGGMAQRLVDELAIQRRDILAANLGADPALALDFAVFLMADRETGGTWSDRGGSSLMAVPPSDPVVGFRTPEAAATRSRAEAAEALDRSWTEIDSRAGRFDAFRALPDEARLAWLGHCISATLEPSLSVAGSRACAFHDHLGFLLGIDVAQWWRPTGANYFDRVSKAMALAAMTEVGGEELASRYSGSKKAELAQACERLFAGELVVEPDVRTAALAWVPEVMRFASAVSADGAEAADTADAANGATTVEPPAADAEQADTLAEPEVDDAGVAEAAEPPSEGDTLSSSDDATDSVPTEQLEEAA